MPPGGKKRRRKKRIPKATQIAFAESESNVRNGVAATLILESIQVYATNTIVKKSIILFIF